MPEQTARLQAGFLSFDRVIGSSLITSCGLFDMSSVHVRQRIIAVAHSSLNNDHFKDEFMHVSRTTPVACLGAVSLDALEYFSPRVTQPLTYLPCGVDLHDFPLVRAPPTAIKRIGFIGRANGCGAYEDVKRCKWAQNICDFAQCELVCISGRKVDPPHQLYDGIDMLLCTSVSETGPLGILEAAAVGLPVISTRVGNVALLSTIQFFSTIAEAVEIVEALNASADLLARYTRAVTSEVRARFSWDVLYAEHWRPLFVGVTGCHLNFVEIGTSDFETCCQTTGADVAGMCVEPVKLYLDNLPAKPGVTKVHGAVSDSSGTMQVYYVTPEVIESLNLPAWCRGCNKVSEPHPLVLAELVKAGLTEPLAAFTVDTVPVFTFLQLMSVHNVRSMDLLKVDTEGHDCTIMMSVLDACVQQRDLFPRKIIFETNEHSVATTVDEVTAAFVAHGYSVERGYDTVLRRLW